MKVAGAPVSFGVFELTPEGAETVSPDQLLSSLAQHDYRGVDLGPLGFLGTGRDLRQRLRDYDLALAGGWIQLPLSDEAGFQASLPALRDTLRVFAEAAETHPDLMPLPTLADAGSAARAANPGHGTDVDSLTDAAWDRLIDNASRTAEIVRAAGFEPTFHHHAGTFVESPDEVDRFLAETDIGLTLDTGHLFIAGGDPVEAVHRWGDRINHLHLKDVDVAELRRVLADGGGMREVWSSPSFVAFGQGQVDLAAVMAAMQQRGFDGWVVIEQDVLPGSETPIADFLVQRDADQQTNRAALRPWI